MIPYARADYKPFICPKNRLYLIFLIFLLRYVKISTRTNVGSNNMEKEILELLSRVSPEEERILSGGSINKTDYTQKRGGFVVESGLLSDKKSGISVRTHTRYTSFPPHRHNYLEIMIALSGSITHNIGDKKILLSPGEILIMNKHLCHSVERAETKDVGVNVIISDGFASTLAKELGDTAFARLIAENAKPSGKECFLHFRTAGHRTNENLIENLLIHLTGEKINMAVMERTVALLLLCLSAERDSLLIDGTDVYDKSDRREEILSYISTSYRTASLSELSKRLYVTVPYLSKHINELFGKSFKELLIEKRIREAKKMLRKTDLAVSEIIRAVGYENDSYFHRIFKQRTGISLLCYRKEGVKKSSLP